MKLIPSFLSSPLRKIDFDVIFYKGNEYYLDWFQSNSIEEDPLLEEMGENNVGISRTSLVSQKENKYKVFPQYLAAICGM